MLCNKFDVGRSLNFLLPLKSIRLCIAQGLRYSQVNVIYLSLLLKLRLTQSCLYSIDSLPIFLRICQGAIRSAILWLA